MRKRYINPYTDFGFKKLFGEESSLPFLLDFLNALLKKNIRKLQLKNTEQQASVYGERKAIFDVYCEDEQGDFFVIELQRVRQDFFKDRVLFYSTFPIRDQNEKGVWDFRLKAVYCILILDFQLPQENKVGNNSRVLHEIQLKDQDGRLFYDKLFYLYLEMPNFKLDLHEVRTSLDKWLYIIKHLKNMKNVPDIFKNTLFEDVLEKAAIDNLSEAEYTAYHSSLKQYRDLKNGLDFAFHNGRTEGEAIGFVKGEEIGRNEGKKEEKILIAKKMKSNGVSIQNIIEYTGLREDEINLL